MITLLDRLRIRRAWATNNGYEMAENDLNDAIREIEGYESRLQLLEIAMLAGAYISWQEGRWHLWRKDGDEICSGKTMVELVRAVGAK